MWSLHRVHVLGCDGAVRSAWRYKMGMGSKMAKAWRRYSIMVLVLVEWEWKVGGGGYLGSHVLWG